MPPTQSMRVCTTTVVQVCMMQEPPGCAPTEAQTAEQQQMRGSGHR